MTVISRSHRLKNYIWQWAIQQGDDHWFGTVAYQDDNGNWHTVNTLSFESPEAFHNHVDQFINGFESADKK